MTFWDKARSKDENREDVRGRSDVSVIHTLNVLFPFTYYSL